MNVTFLIRSLGYGGTERQLVGLGAGLAARGHHVDVIQLYDDSDFKRGLVNAGIEPFSLGLRSRLDVPRLVSRTLRRLRRTRPDIVHGLNVETNLLALLFGRLLSARAVFGIRVADLEALARDSPARTAAAIHRRLLPRAELVLANSSAGARYARSAGASPERVRVIDNGIDVAQFRPDPEGRERIRHEWNVSPDEILIGCVARLAPHKRPELFLRAATEFTRRRPNARFAWVGTGRAEYAAHVRRLAAELGLDGRLVFAGRRDDMPAVHNALDLATLLSATEGSSNTVAEALACGVPCVVSDTGEGPRLVGDARFVVAAHDPGAVAATWGEALVRATPAARAAVRRRIETEFPPERTIAETEEALAALLSRPGR